MSAQIFSIATKQPVPEPESGAEQIGLALQTFEEFCRGVYYMCDRNPEIMLEPDNFMLMKDGAFWLHKAFMKTAEFEINQPKETNNV